MKLKTVRDMTVFPGVQHGTSNSSKDTLQATSEIEKVDLPRI